MIIKLLMFPQLLYVPFNQSYTMSGFSPELTTFLFDITYNYVFRKDNIFCKKKSSFIVNVCKKWLWKHVVGIGRRLLIVLIHLLPKGERFVFVPFHRFALSWSFVVDAAKM